MPVWIPDQIVDPRELVGRRYLDKADHNRDLDDDGCLLPVIEDFHEKREGLDLSFDRLGNPNPNRDTLQAITKIADDDANSRDQPRIFNGWTAIRVREFRFRGWAASINASPVIDSDGSVDNP